MRTLVELGGFLPAAFCAAMMAVCVVGAGRRLLHFRHRRALSRAIGGDGKAAVVYADLDGFTALAEREGDQRAAEVAERFGQEALQACTGDTYLVKTVGDAVLLASPTVEQAVHSAARLTQLASRRGLPAVAVGISYGPCVRRRRDLFGATVNLAARIADIAPPGEIWMSQPVADTARRLDLHCTPVGDIALDGIAAATPLFRLTTTAPSVVTASPRQLSPAAA